MSAARSLTDEDIAAIARAVVAELRAPRPKPKKPAPLRKATPEEIERMARRLRRRGAL